MSEKQQSEIENETIPSMDEFEDQIEKSFHKVNIGDIIKATIVGVSDTEVTLDLGSYAEGIIKANEYSNNPSFSLLDDITIGESINAKVVNDDDGEGNILLSKKQADFVLAWEKLNKLMDEKTVLKTKISQSVKGGVITYLEGIRGFIPASQLSINYVENLDEWKDKEVEAIVITVEQDKNKLVLSSKQVELDKRKGKQANMLKNLEKGMILDATVDSLVPYGAFVKIDDNLSGLVHISQLSKKFIKSPSEVVKEGQEVKVKVLDIKDGKLNLSIKAVESNDEAIVNPNDGPREFSSNQEASTSLADLLKDVNLK
ncbi:MAG TPA: S1 RNA-binding domain-containing protein [Clostridiales bacterium]|nr:S1 RNA-binding domain-containing protein [Clostridiales bacterium]